MAQSAAVAGAVVGVADVVGLAGIQTGHPESGRDPPTRPSTSDAMARRDAPGLGIARQSSRCVGRGGEVEPKRAGARPAFGVARDAVPSRNRWGFAFRRQADGGAHRGRPCARAAELAMLGSITDLLGAETVASSAFESDGSWTEIADLRGRRTPLRHVEEGHVDHEHKIAECLESWIGAFSYVLEDPEPQIAGRRNPQLGALHAIHAQGWIGW